MLRLTLLCICVIVLLCYSGAHSNYNSALKVSPTTFEDLDKPFYEFTCEAHLKQYQWLSWYQEKPKGAKPIYLTTFVTHKEDLREIDLLLPLDESDRDSIIYCITHSEYEENGKKKFREISRSKDILISFQKDKYPTKKPTSLQVMPATFDDSGEPIAEFTCWGYLPDMPGAKQWLSWYQVKGNNEPLLCNETKLKTYYGYVKAVFRKILEPSDNGSHIYCVHKTKKDGYYEERDRSKQIALTIRRDPIHVWGPWINPVKFLEDGNALTIYNNCSAYLYEGELLTWFQIKGSNTSLRLAMIQQKEKYGKIEIKLRKTLDLTDNGSEIYCAKETVDEKVTFKVKGESRRSRIEFTKRIEAIVNLSLGRKSRGHSSETPSVKVVSPSTPISDIMIVEYGMKLDFYCSGSKPIDDRSFTWHTKGPKQHRTTEKKHLEINMEESFHMNQLYCAQNYKLELEIANSRKIPYYFGELARSNDITLLLQGYKNSDDKPMVTFRNSTMRESRTFIDTRSVEFTCSAFVKPYHVVSWYQNTGTGSKPSSEDTLLKTFQLQKTIHEKGQWMKLKLKKTLQVSDNNTKVYCATQRVLSDGFYENTEDQPSQFITLTFQAQTHLETPHVTVAPSQNVIIFDENQDLELVCGGSPPVDGRKYTWYRQDRYKAIHPFSYNYINTTSQSFLKLKMKQNYHMNELYCAQDYIFYLKNRYNDNLVPKIYGELKRSSMIMLLHRTQRNQQDYPQVTPSFYTDQRETFIVFTCFAFMMPWEVLSWYQYKGPDVTEHTLLRTVQLQDTTYKTGQWVILILNKTLEPSDEGSNIYCKKQKVLPGGNYSEASDKMTRQTITLTFNRDILPSKSYVTIEPNSNVHFEVNTTQRFTCSGGKPVDGRVYTWFRIDTNNNLTIPENQSYDSLTYLNTLELSFHDTFHQNQLFCAQVFLSNIKDENGIVHPKYYGKIAKSKIISLNRGVNDGGSQKIILAGLIPILLALIAGLVYWYLRRCRSSAVHDAATATSSPIATPKPKPAERPTIAARPYPSEPHRATATPKGTKRPNPGPKPAARPNLSKLATKTSNSTETPLRPTPAVKPTITARPTPFVTTPKTPTTETSVPTRVPETGTALDEHGDSDAIYGNYVTLFTDMNSDQVTYACLDLPNNKSAAPDIRTQKPSASANIRSTPKTSASADASRTNTSDKQTATTALATSESSPYAQIIGVYTPPNK